VISGKDRKMVPKNRVTLILVVISIIVFCGIQFYVGADSAWAQGRGMNTGPSMGGGGMRDMGDRGGRTGLPGSGQTPPGMSMPGMAPWGSYTPTDDEITRVMDAVRRRDPNKAKELEAIRKTTPQFFINALRQTFEYNNLMATHINDIRTQRRSDFIKWLEQYVPKEADELKRLSSQPELYVRRYDLAWQRYSNVFDKSQKNSDPNWSKNLVADLELEDQQNRLRGQLWNPRIPTEQRNEIESQLKEVVNKRYDINVEQKKIEYEQLLRQLNDLHALIQIKLQDLRRWDDPNEKTQAVNDRMKYLIPMRGFGGGPGPDIRGGGPGMGGGMGGGRMGGGGPVESGRGGSSRYNGGGR
jgi:hypothetical protein